MEENLVHEVAHRDDQASRIGMWLFVFTELYLFGGMFIIYAVYRLVYAEPFHLAAKELNVTYGTINSIILLLSGMTMGISLHFIQKGQNKKSIALLSLTLILGVVFLIIKYFEWKIKFQHGLYPGSEVLINLSKGDVMFFGLYFIMTGLHALHLIVGIILIIIVIGAILRGRVHESKFALHENTSLYWHLVDVIWIFLFPLFYLIN